LPTAIVVACAVLSNIALKLKDELPLDDENEEYEGVLVQSRHW